ncbi:MAG: phosphatase PAP2 family protein [Solirubrobacteraceae bacterium]|nr:phosphatase PAP2 family protein [Solirubrobacteraceae bacterium]
MNTARPAWPARHRSRRPAGYRRRGPERRPLLVQWMESAALYRRRVTRRRRLQRQVHYGAMAYAPAAIALTTFRERVNLPPWLAVAIASGAPLAVAAALPPRSRVRYAAAGMAYMWLFKISWELPADDEGTHRRRLNVDYPIRFDSVLCGGAPPSQRLQRALRRSGSVSLLDGAVCVIYGSWFLPHVLLGYALLRHPQYVPRAAGRLAASYHLTTPFYWFVPTAPPWWASEVAGQMDGEVRRVVRHVVCKVLDRPPPSEDDEVPGNPWGSMPSDHISSAAMTAMALSEIGVAHGVVGWLYVSGAAFAVIYLGEHYLMDVLAGLAIAEVVRRAEPLAAPVVRAVAYALE